MALCLLKGSQLLRSRAGAQHRGGNGTLISGRSLLTCSPYHCVRAPLEGQVPEDPALLDRDFLEGGQLIVCLFQGSNTG